MKNVYVVGYGYWGKNIARVFNESSAFNLTGICDADPAARRGARKLYPEAKSFESYEKVPADTSIVAIVTPTNSHYDLAKYFLNRGHHVFLSKPATKTAQECEDLYSIARDRNLLLWVDHTFVFNPAVRKLKENLSRVGQPLFVFSQRLNLGLYQSDVNVIYDLMPHDLSIVNYLFDSPVKKAATYSHAAAGLPQEDIAHSSFELESGIHGLVTVSWLSPFKVRQFFIVGTEGMLCYDDVEVSEKVKFYDKGISFDKLRNPQDPQAETSRISYRSGDMFAPAVSGIEALKLELNEFSRAFEDRETREYYNGLNLDIMKSLSVVLKGRVDL